MKNIIYNVATGEATTEEVADVEYPAPAAEEIALAERQAETQRLIDGGEYALPDELRRQNLSASAANETMIALLEYLAEAFPNQFGI